MLQGSDVCGVLDPSRSTNVQLGFMRIVGIISLTLFSCLPLFAQTSGRLQGTVRSASGAPAAGVTVVATNQVTRATKQTRTESDGRYSFQLPAGAYRLTTTPTALFDKNQNYGDFAIVKGDTLENVIIEPGKDTSIDIPLAPESPETKPPPQQRTTEDRWRIRFPEYDRYGDRGARGRDIPFKKGRWWDPYNQSVLKGDYPIKGDKTFMILVSCQHDCN
jgi:5-hydroxyisourate hydrolase-like protein (transthyretin family)